MGPGSDKQHLPDDNFTHEYIMTLTFSIIIRFVSSALKHITAVAKKEAGSRKECNKRLSEIVFGRVCFDETVKLLVRFHSWRYYYREGNFMLE